MKFHSPSTTALQAMYEACKKAEQSIQVEEYILADDSVGQRFIALFIRKAQLGVSVQLLLDGWGSKELLKSEKLEMMRAAGVEVMVYRDVQWPKCLSRSVLPRDHRKLVIVDRKIAFIGGVCLFEKVSEWHDMMIEVTGGLLQQLLYVFEQSWAQEYMGDVVMEDSHPPFETTPGLTIHANAPESDQFYFTQVFYNHIANATRSITFTSPYFTPTDTVLELLSAAVERGVEVTIILSTKLDSIPPYYVAKQLTGKLIQQGVNIRYYTPCPIHMKAVIVDDRWAALGSCNIDGLSIHHNREVMLSGTYGAFVQRMAEVLGNCIEQSEEYTYEDWRKRPLIEKLLANVAMPFRRYL